MKRVVQFAIAAMMLFAACSKEDETPPPLIQEQEGAAVVEVVIPNDPLPTATVNADASKYKVSEAEAIRNLNAFLSSMNGDGLSKSGNQVRIAGISAFRTKGSNSISKSLNTEEEYAIVDVDTLMYAVNFADSMGFALMSADKRTAPIFAITEQGNLDFDNLEDEDNEGLMMFLEDAIDKAIEDIATSNDSEEIDHAVSLSKKSDMPAKWNIKYGPSLLLQTRWGQEDPYNYYCNGNVAGCVMIATAQVLAHFQSVGYVSWEQNGAGAYAYFDWPQILTDCKNDDGHLDMDKAKNSSLCVACLCKYLGIALKAKYGKKKTTADSDDAIALLKKMGHEATAFKDINTSDIVYALNNRKLVYAIGYGYKKKRWIFKTKYDDGHAWVIDGYISAVNEKDDKTYTLLHCNWGWDGGANGYYLSDAFDVHTGPDISDSYGLSHTVDEYCIEYKRQYSVITQK